MATLDDTVDYVIARTTADGGTLNLLKLHKLVFYCQAWFLVFFGRVLFEGKFEAWVHGPASRELYKRFVDTKYMYSSVTTDDIRHGFTVERLTEEERAQIDSVLEVYAGMTGTQLEMLTHSEDPWLKARAGIPAHVACRTEIDNDEIRSYYASRLKR
jgi:uncharacterized phage-associated protein